MCNKQLKYIQHESNSILKIKILLLKTLKYRCIVIALLLFSCLVMSDSLDPMDCSLPGSSVHGLSQARILGWVAISFSRDPPHSGIEPTSPALAGRFSFYHGQVYHSHQRSSPILPCLPPNEGHCYSQNYRWPITFIFTAGISVNLFFRQTWKGEVWEELQNQRKAE